MPQNMAQSGQAGSALDSGNDHFNDIIREMANWKAKGSYVSDTV